MKFIEIQDYLLLPLDFGSLGWTILKPINRQLKTISLPHKIKALQYSTIFLLDLIR